MKLKLLEYLESEDSYRCVDVHDHRLYRVDIFVDGTLPINGFDGIDEWKAYKQSFVGKTVDVGYLTPFLYIANNVTLVEE